MEKENHLTKTLASLYSLCRRQVVGLSEADCLHVATFALETDQTNGLQGGKKLGQIEPMNLHVRSDGQLQLQENLLFNWATWDQLTVLKPSRGDEAKVDLHAKVS